MHQPVGKDDGLAAPRDTTHQARLSVHLEATEPLLLGAQDWAQRPPPRELRAEALVVGPERDRNEGRHIALDGFESPRPTSIDECAGMQVRDERGEEGLAGLIARREEDEQPPRSAGSHVDQSFPLVQRPAVAAGVHRVEHDDVSLRPLLLMNGGRFPVRDARSPKVLRDDAALTDEGRYEQSAAVSDLWQTLEQAIEQVGCVRPHPAAVALSAISPKPVRLAPVFVEDVPECAVFRECSAGVRADIGTIRELARILVRRDRRPDLGMHAVLAREELEPAGVLPDAKVVERAETEPSRLPRWKDARDLRDWRELAWIADQHDPTACQEGDRGDGGSRDEPGLIDDDRREGGMLRIDQIRLHCIRERMEGGGHQHAAPLILHAGVPGGPQRRKKVAELMPQPSALAGTARGIDADPQSIDLAAELVLVAMQELLQVGLLERSIACAAAHAKDRIVNGAAACTNAVSDRESPLDRWRRSWSTRRESVRSGSRGVPPRESR